MFAQGRVTESDYVHSMIVHMRPRPAAKALWGLIILFMVFVAVNNRESIWALILALIGGFFFLYLPYKAKKSFRIYKGIKEPLTMETRDDGLFIKRENGEGLIPWTHIHRYKASKRAVLLYITDSLYYLIPSHFFTSHAEFQEFLKLLESYLGKPPF